MDLERIHLAYEGVGEGAAAFWELLTRGPARTWSAPARRILTLREHYSTDDLDRALAHAASYGALSYDSVERIVEARSKPRQLDEYVAAETASRIESALGLERTARSDLSEYDRLPGESRREREEDDGETSD